MGIVHFVVSMAFIVSSDLGSVFELQRQVVEYKPPPRGLTPSFNQRFNTSQLHTSLRLQNFKWVSPCECNNAESGFVRFFNDGFRLCKESSPSRSCVDRTGAPGRPRARPCNGAFCACPWALRRALDERLRAHLSFTPPPPPPPPPCLPLTLRPNPLCTSASSSSDGLVYPLSILVLLLEPSALSGGVGNPLKPTPTSLSDISLLLSGFLRLDFVRAGGGRVNTT